MDISLKFKNNHYQAIVENVIRPSGEAIFPPNIPNNFTQVDLNQLNNNQEDEQMLANENIQTLEFTGPILGSDSTNISHKQIKEAQRRIKLGKNHQKRPLYSGRFSNSILKNYHLYLRISN